MNKRAFKKIRDFIVVFITLIMLLIIPNYIPFKSQDFIFDDGSKRFFTYESFFSELSRHYPLGSTEQEILGFWDKQSLKTSQTRRDLPVANNNGSKYMISYQFDKLFSGSCFLSRGSGKRENISYYFNEEGKLVSVMFLGRCGGYPYK